MSDTDTPTPGTWDALPDGLTFDDAPDGQTLGDDLGETTDEE